MSRSIEHKYLKSTVKSQKQTVSIKFNTDRMFYVICFQFDWMRIMLLVWALFCRECIKFHRWRCMRCARVNSAHSKTCYGVHLWQGIVRSKTDFSWQKTLTHRAHCATLKCPPDQIQLPLNLLPRNFISIESIEWRWTQTRRQQHIIYCAHFFSLSQFHGIYSF